jgi:hypothetical protein
MGVYFQHDSQRDTSTVIVINPLRSFLQRLKAAQNDPGGPPGWREIHKLALSCSTFPWKAYITHLGSQMTQLVCLSQSLVPNQPGAASVPPHSHPSVRGLGHYTDSFTAGPENESTLVERLGERTNGFLACREDRIRGHSRRQSP